MPTWSGDWPCTCRQPAIVKYPCRDLSNGSWYVADRDRPRSCVYPRTDQLIQYVLTLAVKPEWPGTHTKQRLELGEIYEQKLQISGGKTRKFRVSFTPGYTYILQYRFVRIGFSPRNSKT